MKPTNNILRYHPVGIQVDDFSKEKIQLMLYIGISKITT